MNSKFTDAADLVLGTRVSIFQQNWWLQTTRMYPQSHEVKVVEGTNTLGSFSFGSKEKYWFFTRIGNADWSHLAGPIVDQNLDPDQQAMVLDKLLKLIPRATYIYFVTYIDGTYGQLVKKAFERAGYEHFTQINYLRPAGHYHAPDIDGAFVEIIRGLSHKIRAHINSASRKLTIRNIDAKEFIDFYKENLRASGVKRSDYPLDVAYDLINAATRRGQIRVTAAGTSKTPNETVKDDAAVACVWDMDRYYYWMSTRRVATKDYPAKPHPDAIKLLVVNAMAHAQTLGLTFDIDGVSTKGRNHFYEQILALKQNVEHRDIFTRSTWLYKLLKVLLKPK